jgi:hypothetical protein
MTVFISILLFKTADSALFSTEILPKNSTENMPNENGKY